MRILIILVLLLFHTGLVFANDNEIDCSQVVKIDNKAEHKSIIQAVNKMASKYNDKIKVIEVRLLRKMGNWYIIDCTFSEADPAILVLSRDKKGIHVVKELSGNINSEGLKETKEVIYNYFVTNIPKMPRELIYCTTQKISENW